MASLFIKAVILSTLPIGLLGMKFVLVSIFLRKLEFLPIFVIAVCESVVNGRHPIFAGRQQKYQT